MRDDKKDNNKSTFVNSRVTVSEKRKIDKARINSHDFLKLGIKTYYDNKEKAELELEISSLTHEIAELKEKEEFISFKINKRIELKEKLSHQLERIKNGVSNSSLNQDELRAVKIVHNAFERKKDSYKDINEFIDDPNNIPYFDSLAQEWDLSFDELKTKAKKTYGNN